MNKDLDGLAVCRYCGQIIHKPAMGPWDCENPDGSRFYSEWVNHFGFPWCPKTGEQQAHEPKEDD